MFIFRAYTITKTNEDEDEEKETICIGFSTIPVFPVSSTKGETPLPACSSVELPPLVDVAQKFFGIDVKLNVRKIDYNSIKGIT